MKLKDLLKNVDIISCTADPDMEISGISYDSRKTQPGDLFVAVKGFETDGHKFIPKALEKGAAAVLCQDIPADGIAYVQTDDHYLGTYNMANPDNPLEHALKDVLPYLFLGNTPDDSSIANFIFSM